ncbi:hypothetical protein BF93_11285 [Brachybacterium phenoliresistens]|uniref:Pyridoxamine 5-phosphate oxidase n=1 Tax=Brachybacterium phenoliresistens TaxID=396014 RepID=Z9JWM8_9MICO|nr:DUF1697 domain-containing protein [Brachybacterium phenoliresistens]EWS82206.1 hypothetical protein BF93_11285 [Brachybacterium phenoliresistens]
MSRWVALLRGINVGGASIRSAELAALFRELGFEDVRTVLATGNVDFTADVDGDDPAAAAALKERIEAALGERFGYEAWIVLLPHDELAGIVEGYPFAEDPEHHAYVVFASTAQARADVLDCAGSEDPVTGGEGVVYWRCRKGASTTEPFAKKIAAARFKATTTTRNITTLRRLL